MARSKTQNGISEQTPLLQEQGNSQNGRPRSRASSKDDESPFLLDLTPTKFWLLFGPILLQYFVAMFDSFLMASSHPVITSYFNASNAASWLSTSFMLTSTALQPVFGRLSDTVGRKSVYLIALVAFAAATGWCAGAQSIGSLIAARAVCGVGAGAMMAMGNIMVNDLVKIHVRGTYQAYINLLYGGGAAAGAAFGGLLMDTIGWRLSFAVQIPLILFICIISFFTVPANLGPMLAKNSDQAWTRILLEFDLAGSFFLAASVAFLILGLNLGGNIYPWSHPFVITSLVVAFITGGIFILVEKKAKRPVMPLELVSTAPRANLVFCNCASMIGVNHILFNAPLYFQAVRGDSPTIAGFRLSVASVLTTICAVATGFFMTWTGRMKLPQVIGSGWMVLGGILMSALWDGIPAWLATLFVVPPFVGQGFMFPATTLSVLATSSQEDQAVMSSTLGLWRNLGIVLGVAISSLVLQNGLMVYLNRYVTGPDRDTVIEEVRKSVRAVLKLEGKHRAEAVAAYAAALRITFISGLVFFAVVAALLVPIRLPRLGKRAAVPEDVQSESED